MNNVWSQYIVEVPVPQGLAVAMRRYGESAQKIFSCLGSCRSTIELRPPIEAFYIADTCNLPDPRPEASARPRSLGPRTGAGNGWPAPGALISLIGNLFWLSVPVQQRSRQWASVVRRGACFKPGGVQGLSQKLMGVGHPLLRLRQRDGGAPQLRNAGVPCTQSRIELRLSLFQRGSRFFDHGVGHLPLRPHLPEPRTIVGRLFLRSRALHVSRILRPARAMRLRRCIQPRSRCHSRCRAARRRREILARADQGRG